LLAAKTGRKSEQLTREQLALFAAEAGLELPAAEEESHNEDDPQGCGRQRLQIVPFSVGKVGILRFQLPTLVSRLSNARGKRVSGCGRSLL
jgi:hypothetical protein